MNPHKTLSTTMCCANLSPIYNKPYYENPPSPITLCLTMLTDLRPNCGDHMTSPTYFTMMDHTNMP
jgi:hypothetical protein